MKSMIAAKDLDGDLMVRFAAGIAWKYAVTSKERGRIDIGPYAAVLRDVALRGADIPASADLTMASVIELDGDVYYYRTPIPDRKKRSERRPFLSWGIHILSQDRQAPSLLKAEKCLRRIGTV